MFYNKKSPSAAAAAASLHLLILGGRASCVANIQSFLWWRHHIYRGMTIVDIGSDRMWSNKKFGYLAQIND